MVNLLSSSPRFRTYFPDAYKQHYPNAKTHLSSKVRSALPDGSSIFEKTRSKKRRPFTEEEDRALKAGYDRHGTVWATIVKDPIFQEQNRRSTDLRDRFRNAFPELYMAAGYKPRLSAKKKRMGEGTFGMGICIGPAASGGTVVEGLAPQAIGSGSLDVVALSGGQTERRGHPVRAATDDQLTIGRNGLGPVRRKRRHTTQGLFRGGTKSVPESTTNSEDEDSGGGGACSEGEEEKDNSPPSFFPSPASFSVDPATSATTPTTRATSTNGGPSPPASAIASHMSSTQQHQNEEVYVDSTDNSEVEMDIVQPLDSINDSLSVPDYISPDLANSSQSTTWSSLDTPVHPWAATAPPSSSSTTSPSASTSTNLNLASLNNHNNANSNGGVAGAASPTPSTDYFLPPHSPTEVRETGIMIGKSAWGTDWLSPNPRLDPSGLSGLGNGGNGGTGGGSFSHHPSSPTPFSSTQSQPLSLSQLSLNQFMNSQQHIGAGLSSSAGNGMNNGGGGFVQPPGSSSSHLSPHHQNHSHLSHFYSPTTGAGGGGGYGGAGNIFDRYDLFPSSSHLDLDLDFVSEGFNPTDTDTDAFSTFSDPSTWMTGVANDSTMSGPLGGGGAGGAGGRRGGFTHHSSEAGDLIFGARTHQPTGGFGFGFGLGFGGFGSFGGPSASAAGGGSGGFGVGGLGLEGVSSSSGGGKQEEKGAGSHTPALPGIDEIELTGISLDDRDIDVEPEAIQVDEEVKNDTDRGGTLMYPLDSIHTSPVHSSLSISAQVQQQQPPQALALEEIVGLPPSDSEDDGEDGQDMGVGMSGINMGSSALDGMSGMDVMGVLNLTPPATPFLGSRRHSRGFRSSRRTGPSSGMYTPGPRSSYDYDGGGGGSHNRSVSVPPSEHRSPAPTRPSQSQSRTPNPVRKYKPLPSTANAVTPTRTTFQPFQLPNAPPSMFAACREGSGTVAPAQTQTQSSTQARPLTANSTMSTSPNSSTGVLLYPAFNYPGPGDTPDLSFLDLHYPTSSSPISSSSLSTMSSSGDLAGFNASCPQNGIYSTGTKSDDPWGALSHPHGRAQALDLAQSLSLARAHVQAQSKPLCIEPSFTQLVPPPGSLRSGLRAHNIGGQQMLSTLQTTGASPGLGGGTMGCRGHQRGQSAAAALSLAVSPQDLMIRKGKGSDGNKRKRASWDGGAG